MLPRVNYITYLDLYFLVCNFGIIAVVMMANAIQAFVDWSEGLSAEERAQALQEGEWGVVDYPALICIAVFWLCLHLTLLADQIFDLKLFQPSWKSVKEHNIAEQLAEEHGDKYVYADKAIERQGASASAKRLSISEIEGRLAAMGGADGMEGEGAGR